MVLTGGIIVDGHGRRFTDEGRGGVHVANALGWSDDPTGAWVIVDEEHWTSRNDSGDPVPANPGLPERGASIFRAGDIRALAVEIGLDADTLAETFATYNAAAAAGRAAELPVLRSQHARPLGGDLLALPAIPGITFTMGGVSIDAAARVLDVDGEPIPGLHAAGGTAAGPTAGYIGGLATALVFGYIAGTTIGPGSSADVARPSPSTIRVVRVLTLLGDHPDQPLNLSEISRRLDLNRATAHSMLAILTECGYLVREPTTKAFRLGPALIPIAAAGLRPLRDVFVAIHAEMEDLSEQVDARCVVMTPISGRIVIVDAVGKAFPPVVQVGRGAVFAAPYAIALVAWAAEDEVARWLSAETLTDQERETYRERMRVVRDRGFSVATPGTRKELEKAAEELLAQAESPEVESALHQLMVEIARESNELLEIVTDRTYRLRAIAAPVFDAEGKTIAAVSLTGLPELTGRQVRDYGYRLSIAMDRVTKRIGGRAPEPDALTG